MQMPHQFALFGLYTWFSNSREDVENRRVRGIQHGKTTWSYFLASHLSTDQSDQFTQRLPWLKHRAWVVVWSWRWTLAQRTGRWIPMTWDESRLSVKSAEGLIQSWKYISSVVDYKNIGSIVISNKYGTNSNTAIYPQYRVLTVGKGKKQHIAQLRGESPWLPSSDGQNPGHQK